MEAATKSEYKMTELGLIPSDWEVKEIGEIFNFHSTASYSREMLSIDQEFLYIHYGDIHTKFNHFLNVKKSDLPSISYKLAKKYTLIENGDLIMADASEDYNGIGKSVEVEGITDQKVISGLHTMLLRANPKFLSNGFKAYLHSNTLVKKQYDAKATGLKVYGVSKSNLKEIKIPLPPLPEQTAIATALKDTDDLINSLENLIAKKKLIKQGAMQELLKPKEGWVKKKLGEVLKVKHGRSQKEIEVNDGRFPILGSGGIMGFTNQYLYNKPSVLIGRKGTIDKPQFMEIPFWTVDTLFYTEIFENYDAKFIFYVFTMIDWYSYNEASGVPSLNAKTIELIDVHMPTTKSEQCEISFKLTDLDNDIFKLQKKLEKCVKIKQGMMQQLLTGKIRLV
ncbi:MAG: restriction endonuclease subunit S [Bacteroidota bacterium]|nr:restriction endonuclease subunit S [Bacteroidota bacterium]